MNKNKEIPFVRGFNYSKAMHGRMAPNWNTEIKNVKNVEAPVAEKDEDDGVTESTSNGSSK